MDREQIMSLLQQLDDSEWAELQQDMATDLEGPLRHDMGGAQGVPNPIAQARPQAGGHDLPAQNPALARMYASMPRTQGRPIIPGLNDHSDQNASHLAWAETGGV